jgi:exonuclease III
MIVEKIASVNINGLNNWLKTENLYNVLDREIFDIWIIVDTKKAFIPPHPNFDIFYMEEGDVAIFCKKQFKAQTVFKYNNCVGCDIDDLRIIGVYNSFKYSTTKNLTENITPWVNDNTIIAGDWNAVLDSQHRSSGFIYKRDADMINWLNNTPALLDLEKHITDKPLGYTFKSLSRIDYFLGTSYILNVTNSINQERLTSFEGSIKLDGHSGHHMEQTKNLH